MSCKDPGLIHSIDPCQVRNHCHGGEFGKRLDPVKDAAAAGSAFLDIALVQPPQIVVQTLVRRADEILQRSDAPSQRCALRPNCWASAFTTSDTHSPVSQSPTARAFSLSENFLAMRALEQPSATRICRANAGEAGG